MFDGALYRPAIQASTPHTATRMLGWRENHRLIQIKGRHEPCDSVIRFADVCHQWLRSPSSQSLVSAGRLRPVVIGDHRKAGRIEVLQLPAAERVPEDDADQKDQDDAEWNEQIQDIHQITPRPGDCPFAIEAH